MQQQKMILQEIQLELAGICNATCVYCTWQKRTVGKQMMDKDLALRILQEAKGLGTTVLRYHGLGESLLHPDLVEIISVGESLGYDHSISSNCFNLKGELADELSKFKNLSIVLAIPWVMHDKFVDKCVQNVKDFLGRKSDNKRLHVQMVCHEDAKEDYDKLVELLPLVEEQDNAYLHLKQPVTWPNDSPNKGFIRRELKNHPKVIFDERQTPLSIGKGCTMPARFLMVMADGTCVPCCVGMDDWGLGNIGDRTLEEVWTSSRMKEIRNKWRKLDDSIPCGHCKKRKDCIQ